MIIDEKSFFFVANLWYIGLGVLLILGALVIYFDRLARRQGRGS